jgi:hypothetical protein
MKVRFFVTRILCLCLLSATGAPAARADDSSKAAKVAELIQLTGARQFLHAIDGRFDQEEAVRAWGRFYAESLTETDLDAILAYYRTAAGQKDVRASRAALPQLQHYMLEKRTVATTSAAAPAPAPAAVAPAVAAPAGAAPAAAAPASVASAGHTPAGAAPAGAMPAAATAGPATAERITARSWDSNPLAPNGRVILNTSVPERCEVAPHTAPGVHAVPPSGRSVVCVCTDEKGALTRDPVIAESSGDSRVDSGAVKMARSDSGRYTPPTLDGRPQKACFRFAIDFGRHP